MGLNTDYILIDSTKIYIYASDIKFSAKNELISFVEPLTSNPSSSTYNLNMIETTITVSGYVAVSMVGDPHTYSSSGTTLFSAMMHDSVAFVTELDATNSRTYNVVVTSISVDKKSKRFYSYYDDWDTPGFQEFVHVDISMQKATPL